LNGISIGESAKLSPHLEDSHMVADTLNIRDLRQWLCWRLEERDGKLTKIPYSPLTGHRASSTTPETWTGYQEAVRACKEHGYGGIGFVFTPEDDLCGVDLDGCLDPETGEIEPWAQQIVEELDSYTEISPSRTGVHILVRATLPEGRNRKGRFEAYDRGRYFTVTGKHLAGTPQTIEGRQAELQGVISRVFGEESTNGHSKPVAAPERLKYGLSDDEIVRKALSASNGERFSRLWAGDTSGYGSHSEADLALCGMLAFWTGGDATRIDALFRRSGLYRKKWDRKDYRNRTIAEALTRKTEFYEAPKTVKLADGTERKIENLQPEEIGKLLSSVEPEEVSWLWPSWLALGKLALVDGDPGLGKSAMTLDLAARVSAGQTFPDGAPCEPGGVVLLSAEDGLADTIRPRLDAAGADTSKILALATVPDENGHDRLLSIPEDIPIIEKGIRRVEASLLIMDPLMAFLSGDANSHRDQDVRRALAPFAGLAERTGAAVLVVRHLNKGAANNPLYRGGGSIGIIGAARMAFVVGKDPKDENRRVLASTKNNLAMPPQSLMFGLEEAESGSVRVNWLGHSEVSAKDLLATSQDQEHADARSEAVEFLNDVLADGPLPAKQVVEEADEAEISEKTLRRAKKLLDVIAYRESAAGEKRGSGRWMWKLPMVKLVEDGVQGGHQDVQGGQGTLKDKVGHLEQVEGAQAREFGIDKSNHQDGQIVPSWRPDIQDGQRPTLPEGGYLDDCIHGHEGGKGCYLCDPDHPYRKNGSAS
jgi:hypothetical protein